MGDRIKLKIISVPEDKTYNDRKFKQFHALDPEGKTFQYSAWADPLFFKLIKDTEIDSDIIVKDTGKFNQQGEKIINRRVENIYVDGKPLVQAPQQSRGGWQGKSPEQLAIERASIESQTAYNGIIKLMGEKVLTLDHEMSKIALAWAKKKLS